MTRLLGHWPPRHRPERKKKNRRVVDRERLACSSRPGSNLREDQSGNWQQRAEDAVPLTVWQPKGGEGGPALSTLMQALKQEARIFLGSPPFGCHSAKLNRVPPFYWRALQSRTFLSLLVRRIFAGAACRCEEAPKAGWWSCLGWLARLPFFRFCPTHDCYYSSGWSSALAAMPRPFPHLLAGISGNIGKQKEAKGKNKVANVI